MPDSFDSRLEAILQRHCGDGKIGAVTRLTGGATMESWRFEFAGDAYVLRRAPTLEFMAERPFGHDTEAAIIRAAFAAGVTAPEVVAELAPEDELGSGFIMRALPGTPDPRAILTMDDPDTLLREAARDLARIHAIVRDDVPDDVHTLEYARGVAELRRQFEEAGGDRPIIALGLQWLADNIPAPVEPVLNHGDYRLGNLLAEDSHLTGVLDWELAHFGDRHEDLAFGCMAVWRFARYDRPALGLGSLNAYFAAYEAEAGVKVDPARFRFWLIYRTVWWALGCLRMAQIWRSGEDRMLERVVISRRTSEQELDLLMLLEEDAPEEARNGKVKWLDDIEDTEFGEATSPEILTAVSEWLSTIKDQLKPHDRFQAAVARNALGILKRQELDGCWELHFDSEAMEHTEHGIGQIRLEHLMTLRRRALSKVRMDSPKYPALAVARKKWTGED